MADTATSGYRETRYGLSHAPDKTTYFSLALIEHQQRRARPFDRIVVLGTRGSMWDDLAVKLGDWRPDEPRTQRLKVVCQQSGADEDALCEVARAITLHRTKLAIECLLIPICRTQQEAMSVVGLIAGRVAAGDRVSFDVTHGYRHLPLIALAALSLVETAQKARVEGVFYGAWEMRDEKGVAPVIDLGAYLTLLRWTRGLAAFDASGDPTLIARLIEEETDVPLADDLSDAIHRERMLDVDAVRAPIARAKAALDNDLGVGMLFKKPLQDRVAWADEKDLSRRQLALAREAARQRDLMRSILLLFEAAISDAVEKGRGSTKDYITRERAKEALAQSSRAFKELRALRNAVAHALGERTGHVASTLSSGRDTFDALVRIAAALFPGQTGRWTLGPSTPPR